MHGVNVYYHKDSLYGDDYLSESQTPHEKTSLRDNWQTLKGLRRGTKGHSGGGLKRHHQRLEILLEAMYRCKRERDLLTTGVVVILSMTCIATSMIVIYAILQGTANRQPLLCTMGSGSFTTQMFPPDGLCDYIFYDSVYKANITTFDPPDEVDSDLLLFVEKA
ncbi:hypothetical protein MTO96_017606 [Rhipicephalus appendiculatus]